MDLAKSTTLNWKSLRIGGIFDVKMNKQMMISMTNLKLFKNIRVNWKFGTY